jgi:hypothetical protein
MPALTRDEVRAGLVAYLEEDDLRRSEAVTWYEGRGSIHGPPERRPFACFEVDGDQSKWAPVTTQPLTGSGTGYARVELLAEWRSGGDDQCYGNQWIRERAYLVDGANYFAGPINVFVDASRNECSTPATRALLSAAGVNAIQAEVGRQQRRRTEAARGQP